MRLRLCNFWLELDSLSWRVVSCEYAAMSEQGVRFGTARLATIIKTKQHSVSLWL